MNKKFFTLIASAAMLVASLGTANAQAEVKAGTDIDSLSTNDAGKYLYQLGVEFYNESAPGVFDPLTGPSHFLSAGPEGVLHLDRFDSSTWGAGGGRTYGQSLWCINFADYMASGGYHVGLVITNKASNKPLTVDSEDSYSPNGAADSINVSFGGKDNWGFSAVYERRIEQGKPLYAYFTEDSVLFIIRDKTALSPDGSDLGVARMEAAEFFAAVADPTTASKWVNAKSSSVTTVLPTHVAYFYIQKPAHLVLNAHDFNTLLDTKDKADFRTLAFSKDRKNVQAKNPWSDYALKAFDANRAPGSAATATTNSAAPAPGYTNPYILPNSQPWVYFGSEEGSIKGEPTKFLRVDTAYSATLSTHLLFNFGTNPTEPVIKGNYATTAPITLDTFQQLQGQYYFRLTYSVYDDSLGIDVAEARKLQKTGMPGETEFWREIPGLYTYTKPPTIPSPAIADSPNYLYWGDKAFAAGTDNTEGYAYQWYDDALGVGGAKNATTKEHPDEWWLSHYNGTATGYPWNDADQLHVVLRDIELASDICLITIGAPEANTFAQLGVNGCDKVQIDFESKPEGLYTIKNKDGQYLGVPIYTDSLGVGSVNSPLWTTLFEQEPDYMPSYQWVVKHTRSSNVSPITIINREFPNIQFKNVQLKKAGIELAGSEAEITKDNFTLVKEEYSTNPYLGYLQISERDANLNTYDLNYRHKYNPDQYLGVSKIAGKDIAVVKEGQTKFKFIPAAAAATNYGYQAALVSGSTTKWQLNIAQLKRTAYTLTQDDKVLRIDGEGRYVYEEQPEKDKNGLTDNAVFLVRIYNTLMKEDGPEHYYALLDTNSVEAKHGEGTLGRGAYNFGGKADYSDGITPRKIGYVKLGVADGSLWTYAQVQRENRTSAFAIKEYTAPLYRRFDGRKYTYGNGNDKKDEKYKGEKDANAPIWLKFHAVPENYIFLAENSKYSGSKYGGKDIFRHNLVDSTISFAGLYNEYQYPERFTPADQKLAYEFYVDTAYVKRPGSISTSYTAMPQYMLALRPQILLDQEIWYNEKVGTFPSKEDAENWVNTGDNIKDGGLRKKDVKGLTRGFYLFNAQDSVNAGNKDYIGKVGDNIENTTRFAFVDGVHQGDTFYVLPKYYGKDKTSDIKTGEIQFDPEYYLHSLPDENKHYLGDNTHYVPRYDKRDAKGNHFFYTKKNGKDVLQNGKSMVFQFRLKQGGVPNPDRQFYIESRRPANGQPDEFTAAAYPAKYNGATNAEIGPDYAVYLNNLNGAPVQSEVIQFNDANLVNAAQGFNVVEETADADNDHKAVSNETAVAGSVKVIGEVGSVTILNAAGKKVAISNVLGQSVANTVLTSDNATIALPKGIVVVAIAGEPAVKAVVK